MSPDTAIITLLAEVQAERLELRDRVAQLEAENTVLRDALDAGQPTG